MKIVEQVGKFFAYLAGKTSEISDLNAKDVLLAKTVLDIHRKRTHTGFVLVPLFSLHPIHAIDRDNALAATEKRAEQLRKVKSDLLKTRSITRAVLAEHLPSISWIKVVRASENSYIAYEGNGRLIAMLKVFRPEDEMMVEVEEYYFKRYTKILRRMNRVRRMNGLEERLDA